MAADIVWKTTKLPDAIINVPYEASLAFTGNATAITAASASPTLPAGLTFSADKVRITGTPTAAGQWTGTITLTDTAGAQASGTLYLNVRYSMLADTVDLATGTDETLNADLGRLWPQTF